MLIGSRSLPTPKLGERICSDGKNLDADARKAIPLDVFQAAFRSESCPKPWHAPKHVAPFFAMSVSVSVLCLGLCVCVCLRVSVCVCVSVCPTTHTLETKMQIVHRNPSVGGEKKPPFGRDTCLITAPSVSVFHLGKSPLSYYLKG